MVDFMVEILILESQSKELKRFNAVGGELSSENLKDKKFATFRRHSLDCRKYFHHFCNYALRVRSKYFDKIESREICYRFMIASGKELKLLHTWKV